MDDVFSIVIIDCPTSTSRQKHIAIEWRDVDRGDASDMRRMREGVHLRAESCMQISYVDKKKII